MRCRGRRVRLRVVLRVVLRVELRGSNARTRVFARRAGWARVRVWRATREGAQHPRVSGGCLPGWVLRGSYALTRAVCARAGVADA